MGVSGLLPMLKSIQHPKKLQDFSGLTLGVDTYGWLHRAAYSCASELGQNKATKKYIKSIVFRVKSILSLGIKLYMVFDGDHLPSKAETETSRAERRNERRQVAMQLVKAGKTTQATHEFQKCIDVTPEMAASLMEQLKQLGVECVVAPYEADAQLVYLEKHGHIDGIISDDSDLLVFGAKRLITKLDPQGQCMEINRRHFAACREINLTGWTDADFRRMAIMSGCDYLKGLPNIGVKTANRLLIKYKKSPERVVRGLQLDGKIISENYMLRFQQAELTFLHQWVFCPKEQKLVHLNPLDGPHTAEELPFIGAYVEPEQATAIAMGLVNPITKEPFADAASPFQTLLPQMFPGLEASPSPKKPCSTHMAKARIPMGEMNANCFTVDPQRVAQLTDHGRVPRVFPLPRPYVQSTLGSDQRQSSPRPHRRHTEPVSRILSRLATSRPSTPESLPAPQTQLLKRPVKKVRLCDHDGEAPVSPVSPTMSRFFAGARTQSPKRARSDAYLFSDDSIEEALRGLPNLDQWKAAPTCKPLGDGEWSHDAANSGPANGAKSSLDMDSGSFMPLPSDTRAEAGAVLRQKRHSLLYDTPLSSVSSRSSLFSAASAASTAPSTVASVRPLTTLQRMRIKARTGWPSSPLPKNASAAPRGLDQAGPAHPLAVPLPQVEIDEVIALTKPYGSEDQMGPGADPDSDDEEDDESGLSPVRKLDIGRFHFSLRPEL